MVAQQKQTTKQTTLFLEALIKRDQSCYTYKSCKLEYNDNFNKNKKKLENGNSLAPVNSQFTYYTLSNNVKPQE